MSENPFDFTGLNSTEQRASVHTKNLQSCLKSWCLSDEDSVAQMVYAWKNPLHPSYLRLETSSLDPGWEFGWYQALREELIDLLQDSGANGYDMLLDATQNELQDLESFGWSPVLETWELYFELDEDIQLKLPEVTVESFAEQSDLKEVIEFLSERYCFYHEWSPPCTLDFKSWLDIFTEDLDTELSFLVKENGKIAAASTAHRDFKNKSEINKVDVGWIYQKHESEIASSLLAQQILAIQEQSYEAVFVEIDSNLDFLGSFFSSYSPQDAICWYRWRVDRKNVENS